MSRKIPEHAQKVFEGKLFEVWQWEQKMFDGSIKTFEMLKRPNTAVVIATVGDQILLQNEEQPHVSQSFVLLPGGRCEEGEESLVAAKRELLEETGYVSDDWFLWKETQPVAKLDWTIFTFIARNCVLKQAPQLDTGEKITSYLVSFEEFLKLTDNPHFYERELIATLWRARCDAAFKEELRKTIFGS